MRIPFSGKRLFTTDAFITQYFAANPNYYKKWNLFGHEGLDLVPRGADWTVLSPFRGEVMRVYDSQVYGKTVMIWNPAIGYSTRIAHLAEVYTAVGQFVADSAPIGKMGNTPDGRDTIGGGVMPAHLHVNMIPMVKWGVKLYETNGFKGRVDPLPVLELLGNRGIE